MGSNKNTNRKQQKTSANSLPENKNVSTEQYNEIAKEADKNRTRKPGSQGNSSDRHNNGRGGGK